MNYSAINYVTYTIGLEKEMFVIGGTFAAGLTEPALARAMGHGGCTIDLHVSSHNFEVLKDYSPSNPRAKVMVEENKLSIRDGIITIYLHRGIPSHWVNQSGYRVQDPLPLKQWLINNELPNWAKLIQDKPFEQRLEGLTLTEEESAFKQACINHDWYSDFSDDIRVMSNGHKEYTALVQQRDAIGGNAKAIFEYYSSK